MVRIFKVLTICAVLLLSLTAVALAANETITITCKNNGECEQQGKDEPFFVGNNLVPGQTLDRAVTIRNQRRDDGCVITLQGSENTATEPYIRQQLKLVIFKNNQVIQTYSLEQVVTTLQSLYIDTIDPRSSQNYLWQIQFQKAASNDLQGSSTNFDLDLTFTCDESTRAPTPLPSTTPTPSTTPNPSCQAQPPQAVNQVSLEPTKNPTQVTLRWQAIANATSYKVSFGTTDQALRYTDIDVGNVTSYKLTNLNPQRDYYFTVIAVRDCARSGLGQAVTLLRDPTQPTLNSEALLALVTGTANNTPTGQVLGAQIEVSATESGTTNPNLGSPKPNDLLELSYVRTDYMAVAVLILFILICLYFYKKRT